MAAVSGGLCRSLSRSFSSPEPDGNGSDRDPDKQYCSSTTASVPDREFNRHNRAQVIIHVFLYLNYLKCRKIRAAGRCLMHRLTMFHCKGLDGNFWIKLHHGAMFPRKRLKFWGYSTLLFFSTAVSIRFVYFRVNGLGLLFIPDFPF